LTQKIKQEQRFFFEKENQKTFAHKELALLQHARQRAKVFASFFKRKRFLPSLSVPPVDRLTAFRINATLLTERSVRIVDVRTPAQ
jgi:hypothetical protein